MNGEGFRVTQEIVGGSVKIHITMPLASIESFCPPDALKGLLRLDVSGIEALQYIMHFSFGTAAMMCEGTGYTRAGLKLREISIKILDALKAAAKDQEQ